MIIDRIHLMDYQTAGSSNGAIWTEKEAELFASECECIIGNIPYETEEAARDGLDFVMDEVLVSLGWYAIPEHTSYELYFV